MLNVNFVEHLFRILRLIAILVIGTVKQHVNSLTFYYPLFKNLLLLVRQRVTYICNLYFMPSS
jgi:hypothetical protein